ncbi:hypothetical protein V2J09_006282 [Rumex salicifolius]
MFRLLKCQSRRATGPGQVHIRERRVRGRGDKSRPDHPICSNRLAWFYSQSNFVTFVYPSDSSPFGGSLGTDSLYSAIMLSSKDGCFQAHLLAYIRSFPGLVRQNGGHPSALSALPRAIDIIHSTEIDFAENQLYPILVGLSPLATSHPRILPHMWVWSSKAC